jgi:hypothetical protein
MGITKTEYFTEEQNELAILAKAMATCSYAIIEHLIKVNSCVRRYRKRITSSTTYRIPTLKGIKNAGLIKVILETLFVTASMKKASIKYEAFLHINTYLEIKKINVVNFKLVENEVIRN